MTSKFRALAIALAIAAVSSTAFAKPKRHGHAHTHGEAKLDIGIDGRTASVMLVIDTQSLLGFEHEAKTQKEKQAVANAYEIFRKKAHLIFAFEDRLQCKFSEKKLKIQSDSKDPHHEGHRSLHADFEVVCASPIAPSRLSVALAKEFKVALKIKVRLLTENGAKSFVIPGVAAFDLE